MAENKIWSNFIGKRIEEICETLIWSYDLHKLFINKKKLFIQKNFFFQERWEFLFVPLKKTYVYMYK